MPIATVDEHYDPCPREQHVSGPAQVPFRPRVYAISKTCRVNETSHGKLGLGITPAIALHRLPNGFARSPGPIHTREPTPAYRGIGSQVRAWLQVVTGPKSARAHFSSVIARSGVRQRDAAISFFEQGGGNRIHKVVTHAEATFALIEEFFDAGDATPPQSPGGNR